MMPPNSSLVKYDTPTLVTKNLDKKSAKVNQKYFLNSEVKIAERYTTNYWLFCGTMSSSERKTMRRNGRENITTNWGNFKLDFATKVMWICGEFNIEREWTENGQLWVQHVSSTPATRLDVVNLQEELDRRLQQRQARETGICPVRRELYYQVF